MQQIAIDQFVDRFEDEGDKYIAAVIICDQLPVRITKVGFDNISMIALEPFVPGFEYCIVCEEFPDFFIDSGVQLAVAFQIVEQFQLNLINSTRIVS